MKFLKSNQFFSRCLIIVTLFVIIQMCDAQNSPQDYVDAHNYARISVGVGLIEWDNQLAVQAYQDANKRIIDCSLEPSSGSSYGQNLAKGSGDFMTGTFAVQTWIDQQANYDYGSNTCVQGTECGAYTQVVWKDSVRVGCGRVQCYDGSFLVDCYYDPAGNFFGERPF